MKFSIELMWSEFICRVSLWKQFQKKIENKSLIAIVNELKINFVILKGLKFLM